MECTHDQKLDKLLTGHAVMATKMEQVQSQQNRSSEELSTHIRDEDIQFEIINGKLNDTTISIVKLETHAGLHRAFAETASRRANMKWTMLATFSALVAAGVAVAQAIAK